MEEGKLNIGDLVQIIDLSYYSVRPDLGIYTIIEEHKGEIYTTYVGALMFGEKHNRAWIFPSQENKAWKRL